MGKADIGFFKRKKVFLASVVIALICGVLAFIGGFDGLDNKVYDMLLRFVPEPPQSGDVLFIDIDDESLDVVGTWPWTRDVLADVVVRMKELGAACVTFDIEYLSASQHGIDPNTMDGMPALIDESEVLVASVMEQLAYAAASGQIPVEYLPEFNADVLESDVRPSFGALRDALEHISRDNDDYFGRALQFFGDAWLTVNYTNVVTVAPDSEEYARSRFLLRNVTDPDDLVRSTNAHTFSVQSNLTEGFSPAQDVLSRRAAGAGFTNVIVDDDGTRRRMELLYKAEDAYLAQLVFAPILNHLDVQALERTGRTLVLHGARTADDGARRNITIPLDRNGYMLVNWQHKSYNDSFRHVPVLSLIAIDDTEERIVACLDWLYNDCYLLAEDGSWLSYYVGAQQLLDDYARLSARKRELLSKCNGFDAQGDPLGGEISDDEYAEYFSSRKSFFSDCRQYLDAGCLDEVEARLEEIAQTGGASAEEVQAFHDAVSDVFSALGDNLDVYDEDFAYLSAALANAFCIVGNTATGNTDMGTTPFVARYPNVGTHGNVYNTIVQGDFIYPVDWEVAFAVSVLFSLVFTWFSGSQKSKIHIVLGLLAVIAVPVSSIMLMRFASVYVPMVAAFLVVVASYLVDVVVRFTTAESDKRFLKQAFSTYLSEDVVDDIMSNPDKLSLGGEEKNLTAFFSDVKSFSTLSEKVTPVQLVSILNEYLTAMSDLILDEKGTIDKYIGDAIVSFFGAPTDLPDHAFRACATAVRMKQVEKEFNARRLADSTLPMPICTRVGINTGRMVVGNMGTDRKMNYTIMGNNVNIASRLEGVNKVYNSWILVSESTWNEANSGEHKGELVVRRLDKVRVVGINEPVQLYNVMGFSADMTRNQLSSIDAFHTALDLYLERKFPEAIELFHRAAQLNPEDGATRVFMERCRKFIASPPAENWSGVMTMMSK